MNFIISKLASPDLAAVDKLMKRNSKTLGFLPEQALLEYLEKGGVFGAKTKDGQLIGYLLYAVNPKYFRITHLCISEEFRNQGFAKIFINTLKECVTTQKSIRLHCRRDFPAHEMWPELGFIALDEQRGRSAAGHLLTHWYLTFAPDDQLDLFQANTSDEALDVVIDAQIFFDFDEPNTAKTVPSKALYSDFLIDSLNLWITDELFNEINRNDNSDKRIKSRNRALEFLRAEPTSSIVEHFDSVLRGNLNYRTRSQKSDIRHLANAAASEIDTFVTRDQYLLRNAAKIFELTNLKVLSPTELIIQHHEISDSHTYTPSRVSGFSLAWRRLASNDLATIPIDSFLNQGERIGKFRENLDFFLANPTRYECVLLRSKDQVIAIRVHEIIDDKELKVHLARVARTADQLLFRRYLVSDTIDNAVKNKMYVVIFHEATIAPGFTSDLLETGFTKCEGIFVRFCFSCCFGREEILAKISKFYPVATGNFEGMTDHALERHCSPVSLPTTTQDYFLIPVRYGYAISLIDTRQAEHELFGGEQSVLLRWDNVYYRKKTHHNMLQAPARILWYVSTPKKQIVAVSHLDTVEIDTPKNLYKKFKKFGILEREDLYQMCDRDPKKEIMVLKFSHTFPFREPVSLDTLRTVYKEDRTRLSLQSPLKVPMETFQKIFQLGYPK